MNREKLIDALDEGYDRIIYAIENQTREEILLEAYALHLALNSEVARQQKLKVVDEDNSYLAELIDGLQVVENFTYVSADIGESGVSIKDSIGDTILGVYYNPNAKDVTVYFGHHQLRQSTLMMIYELAQEIKQNYKRRHNESNL